MFDKTLYLCILILSHSSYMPCPPHPPWLDHSNYTWRRVQVMKLLIMQFSPTSSHFISLWSKYLLNTLLLWVYWHQCSVYVCHATNKFTPSSDIASLLRSPALHTLYNHLLLQCYNDCSQYSGATLDFLDGYQSLTVFDDGCSSTEDFSSKLGYL
jgi:hypothetical protein